MRVFFVVVLMATGAMATTELAHMLNACETKKIPTACYKLGIFFEEGMGGIRADLDQARLFYAKACALEYADACDALESLDHHDASK
jgi:TPR repeat protein